MSGRLDAGARYRDQIGRGRSEVTTPALLLDLAAARRNVEKMATECASLGTRLRPHVKSHKCPELARLQIEAGAVGVTCATAWEAVAMARAGITDLFVANQIVQQDKLRALTSLASGGTVTVAVDDEEQVARLASAATTAEAELGVVIEIDVGMGRAGVRSVDEAQRLAERIATTPPLAFRGLHGYEGHCMMEADPVARERATRKANGVLTTAARRLAAAGHRCEIVTAGGTGTFRTSGADPDITDVQAGSYVLMDSFHERLLPNTFEVALTVAGTVISRKDATVVIDVGRKSVSTEFGSPTLEGLPEAKARSCAEEHCTVGFVGPPPLLVGESVELIPTYTPTTVNLHDVFHVIEGDTVIDIWPVCPRGPGSLSS